MYGGNVRLVELRLVVLHSPVTFSKNSSLQRGIGGSVAPEPEPEKSVRLDMNEDPLPKSISQH